MTVRELITKLRCYDPNSAVGGSDDCGQIEQISSVSWSEKRGFVEIDISRVGWYESGTEDD